MPAQVTAVDPKSPADRAGVKPGDTLISVNGHAIADVLDYKFYTYDAHLRLALEREGQLLEIILRKAEGRDVGLNFKSYLMDQQKGCANSCVFCFVDQLPRGLRPTLYFKDDDARLSFLLGNYITLTNLSDSDAQRIIRMHVSPLNISVHTTDPALRTRMLGHPRGGESLRYLYDFAAAGLKINAQVVLCPGLNDGEALARTLTELSRLHPSINSVAVVPVGLTRHREGLYPLKPVDETAARAGLACIDEVRAHNVSRVGAPICAAADELYLKAGLPLPGAEYYGEFDQLENGVGLMALFQTQLESALALEQAGHRPPPVGVVCGMAAGDFMTRMIDRLAEKCDNLECSVFPIRNEFFGPMVDVSGLVTGGDIIRQLRGRPLPPRLLIPDIMLRGSAPGVLREDVFLDDVTLSDIETALGVQVEAHPVDGDAFLDAVLGL